ncbi:MAG: response regulator, partial [Synechococcales cyanobacterium CRU_2_2]|nr:response regulator [Synechococcales cyanobacterium CRU_2_2]
PVDRFWNEQEVAIRPVMSPMPLPTGFSGATVLGDGRVIPLVGLAQLIRFAAEQRDACATQFAGPAQSSVTKIIPASTPANPSDVFARQVVLVIDDSVHVRRYLTLTLERAGYEVVPAKDGREGVDKLLGGLRVAAVLCDVEMPRLDGYGVLDEIKGRPEFAKLPITMLTSRNSDKHRKLALKLGASAYFSKPYNDQALLKTLEELIQISTR